MNKVYELSEAIRKFVKSGDYIAFGGFTTNRKPYAAVHEIIRQGLTDFIVDGGTAGGESDLLIGAGRVKVYINSYTANSGFSNVSRRFRHAIETGQILFEDYSFDTAPMMYHAAALGLPYLPVRQLLGSDLEDKWGISEEQRKKIDKLPDKKMIVAENPFNPGEKVCLLPVPKIDVAIIHVQKAAPDGTCRIEGARFADVDLAAAAKYTIVTCEELVTCEEIRRHPELNSIPGFVVDAVVHVPFGAHPSQCYNYYDYDREYFMAYDEAGKTDEGFQAFLQEWVYGTKNHDEYLDKLGASRLEKLRVVPGVGFHVNEL